MHNSQAMSKTPVKWMPAPQTGQQIAELYRAHKAPAEIANEMGCTPRTVYRWLHKLRDAGEIEPAGEEKTA
jgi:transposase-like protein